MTAAILAFAAGLILGVVLGVSVVRLAPPAETEQAKPLAAPVLAPVGPVRPEVLLARVRALQAEHRENPRPELVEQIAQARTEFKAARLCAGGVRHV